MQVHGPFKVAVPGNVGPPPVRPELPDYTGAYQKCDHPTTRLVRYCQSNNVWVARLQCVTCGHGVRNVHKATVPDFAALPEYDAPLRQRWLDRANNAYADRRAAYEAALARHNADWWAWYDRYLASPQWAAKRSAVLVRDRGLCCGCGTRRATQVHHLTYARVWREMLFDLVSVCDSCHAIVHANRDGR
jgi:5-methylcytosine-specific restriction endonuclease McrA